MKTVVAVFRPPFDEGRKRRGAGTYADRLATKPVQEPVAANRHIRFDFHDVDLERWCIGAPVIAPQSCR